jgi:hypothetical protein
MFTHALHNTLSTLVDHTSSFTLILAILADWGGVFILLGIVVASSFLERKRITVYSHHLAANRNIPLSEVDILKSIFQRRKLYLRTLLTGDLKHLFDLKRYHRKVSEAAFAFHRVKLGDSNASRNLARLEQEYQKLQHQLA